MRNPFSRRQGPAQALELQAERAGRSLACPFASSAEFEAAVIQAKRLAGAYGPRRHRRLAVSIGIASGIIAAAWLIAAK